MTRFFITLSMVLLFSVQSFVQSRIRDIAPASKDYSIVILGDQLSDDEDFLEEDTLANRLEEAVRRYAEQQYFELEDVTVTNLSYPGQSIMTAASMVDEVAALKPDIVIIQLGLNDVREGTEVHILERALANLIVELRQKRMFPLLVGDVPPKEIPYTYASHYNVMLRQVSGKYHAHFLDKYVRTLDGKIELLMADDEIPNEDGKKVLADLLAPKLFHMMDMLRDSRTARYEMEKKRAFEEAEEAWKRKWRERQEMLQKRHNERYGIQTAPQPIPESGAVEKSAP